MTRAPDRWVGGVAGAVARRTGLDLTLVRGLFVLLAVFGGIGVLLYGLAWALLPEPDGRIHVEQAGRGSWTSGLTGAATLVVLGLWRPNLPFLGDGGAGGLLWTLFWIGAVALAVYWIVNRSGAALPRPDAPQSPSQGSGGESDDGPVPPLPVPDQPDPHARPAARTHPLPYQPGQAAWSESSPAYAWPGYTGAYVTPAPTRPTIHRHRPARPSGPTTALLIGGGTLVAAVLLMLDYTGVVAFANPAVVALATAAALLSLGVVVLGVRGKSSGLVGLIAALAAVGALVCSFTTTGGTWIAAQQTRTAPASLEVASDGYSIMAGRATIDLADLAGPPQDVVVPVISLVSEVTVIVPDDVPVEVRRRMALGTVDLGTADAGTADAVNPEASGPALILDVRGAMSDVTIVTEPRTNGPDPAGDTP